MIARDDRLRRGWEVEVTRSKGRSVSNRRLVLFTRPNTMGHSRFGVAAGKRLGNAVRRNRAKRLIREALRLSAPQIISGVDVLVIARNGLRADDTLAEVQKDLQHLLRKAGLHQPVPVPATGTAVAPPAEVPGMAAPDTEHAPAAPSSAPASTAPVGA